LVDLPSALRLERRNAPVVAYFATLAFVACVLGLLFAGEGVGRFNVWAVAAVSVVGAGFERSSVRLSRTTEASIALLPVVFAAVLFGPVAAMFVAAASMVTDFSTPYLKWAVYTA